MRRDMDLVRTILTDIEAASPERLQRGIDVTVDGHSDAEVNEHLRLLHDEGFVYAIDASNLSGTRYIVRGLTWKGLDFVQASIDEGAWKKTKEIIKQKGGAFTFDLFVHVLQTVVKQQVLSA